MPGVQSFADPDEAALRVAFEYLTALEGPMWKGIRGLGLAYSYRLFSSPEQGDVTFGLYRSSQLIGAFEKAKSIVGEILDGVCSFEPESVEAAKAGVVYSLIARESTVSAAAQQSFINKQFRRAGRDYSRTLLKRIASVSVSDLKYVVNKYLADGFKGRNCRIAIATPAAKAKEIAEFFERAFDEAAEVNRVESLDDFFTL